MILTNEPTRVIYGGGDPGTHHLVPELPLVGWTIFRQARSDHLPTHRHSNAYELHYIVDGEVDWLVDGETYLLRAGDVFITRPGEPHGGDGGVMHACTLIWFLLAAPILGSQAPRTGLPTLNRSSSRFARATPAVASAFRRIFDEHANPDTHSVASVRATLGLLLIDLDRLRQQQSRAEEQAHAAALSRAVEYLRRDFASPINVAGACAAAGLNRTTLGRLFADRFGLSVIRWSNRERIRAATRRLLETGDSITRIATELGFASSQHFSTAFRLVRGVSPSGFRSQARTQADGERPTPIEWTEAVERRQWIIDPSKREAAQANPI